jgi:hypothetical protein
MAWFPGWFTAWVRDPPPFLLGGVGAPERKRARVPGYTAPEEPYQLTHGEAEAAARQRRRKEGAKAGRTFLVAHEKQSQAISKRERAKLPQMRHDDPIRVAIRKKQIEAQAAKVEAEYRRGHPIDYSARERPVARYVYTAGDLEQVTRRRRKKEQKREQVSD